jgi:glycosyltransferase involved in cell wall biosynthesis
MAAARKIRLVEFTPSLAGGGAEERIARVLASLDRDRFDLTWIGFGDVQHNLSERGGDGVRFVTFARDPTRGIEARLILEIAQELSRLAPDIVHVHNWSTSLYGISAARLAGVPSVLYGEGGRDSPEPPSPRRRALMRALAPHVDRFTAVCEFLGREVAEHWAAPDDRISVIPTGVDLARIDAAPSRKEARERLGLPSDALVVGAVAGRFRQVKRLPHLIDAVGALAEELPSVHLVLVGDPLDDGAAYRAHAEARGLTGRFHLTGHIAYAATVLRAFDVMVNCSVFEGSSNAILEAMGSGLAVVATGVGGTMELIEHRVRGLIIPPEDVPRLSRAIRAFLRDEGLRRSCGERARAFIRERYSQERMASAYRSLYLELAEQPLKRSRLQSVSSVGSSLFRLASVPGV